MGKLLIVLKRYFTHSASFIFSCFKYDMTKIPAIESISQTNTYYGYKKGNTSKRSPGYEHSKNHNDKFSQTLKKDSEAADDKTGKVQDGKKIDIKV